MIVDDEERVSVLQRAARPAADTGGGDIEWRFPDWLSSRGRWRLGYCHDPRCGWNTGQRLGSGNGSACGDTNPGARDAERRRPIARWLRRWIHGQGIRIYLSIAYA